MQAKADGSEMAFVRHRMYEKSFPNVDDIVIVQVKSIGDIGAYVELLEYEGIEGLIVLTEISRKRVHSVKNLIRVGSLEVAVVIHVDAEKRYIDLSKKRVHAEDAETAIQRFNMSKKAQNILRHVSLKSGMTLGQLYHLVGWPLEAKYGHTLHAFTASLTKPSILEQCQLEPAVLKDLRKAIGQKMTPKARRLQAQLNVQCWGYEGIDSIKECLLLGQKQQTPETSIKIRIVKSPYYLMTGTSSNPEKGLELFRTTIRMMQVYLQHRQGQMTVDILPQLASEADDDQAEKEIEKLLDRFNPDEAQCSFLE